VAQLEPERAVATLPGLVPAMKDRERLVTLVERVIEEGGVHGITPSPEQLATFARIREALATGAPARLRKPAGRGKSHRKAVT